MADYFSRSELLLGSEGMSRLKSAHVAVFGIGGVGGFAVEALARTGIGKLDLFDNDTVSVTNINRQIIALTDTIGKFKTEVMAQRIEKINPACITKTHNVFFMPENSAEFDFTQYDYVIDAVDTVTAKIEIICKAQESGVPVISSMGAGNKLDPTRLEVTDIYKTTVCPLARVMRSELRKRGIKKLKTVFSTEPPLTPRQSDEPCAKRVVPGSVSFVPSVAGLIIAGEVIKDIAQNGNH